MISEYLLTFDTRLLPMEEVDCLVIGAGVAGLRVAAGLEGQRVLITCKGSLNDSSSWHAQGGIAVALSEGDSLQSHILDTMEAGCGINNQDSVKILVEEGIARVRELISWGARFDMKDGQVHFSREAAHSFDRILHANGDAIGKELVRVLLAKIASRKEIRITDRLFLVDLLSVSGIVYGALFFDLRAGSLLPIRAKTVVLASGGASSIYQESTNPAGIIGDAQSAFFRKGGILSDLEFFQFHPTTLYLAGAPRFLISEAVRGEGGILRDKAGIPFMEQIHPRKDLAPRDIVSRAMVTRMKETGTNTIFLDVRHLHKIFLKERFPLIYRTCLDYGIDIASDPIPVRPAAHYCMGGIRTDINGRSSLENLYACGEAACTGVHGANRLASNSLLESLVFGARTAKTICRHIDTIKKEDIECAFSFQKGKKRILIDTEDLRRSIKSLLWKNVGIERSAEGLAEAERRLSIWQKYAFSKAFDSIAGWEIQNMLLLGRVMTFLAYRRTESRGAHFRCDYPDRDDIAWKMHQTISSEDPFFLSPEDRL
ncbi:MAG: L-aspartate oxidase [Candidatus Ratteibacteria bacterium]|jgi:L-aspartate oxidase